MCVLLCAIRIALTAFPTGRAAKAGVATCGSSPPKVWLMKPLLCPRKQPVAQQGTDPKWHTSQPSLGLFLKGAASFFLLNKSGTALRIFSAAVWFVKWVGHP